MRQLMHLPEETKITKKFLRETMTQAQFDEAWQYYNELLKQQVEADVLDFPAPTDDAEASAEGGGDGPSWHQPAGASSQPTIAAAATADSAYATAQQIARLKLLAKEIGDDAYADVQDMLEHHPEGLVIGVYEIVRQRLKARKAARKEETASTP